MAEFIRDVSRKFIGLILVICGTLENTMVSGCGYTFTNPIGVITSPNYPQNYLNGLYCEWNVNAPEGFRIKVDFTVFELEVYSPNPCVDYLEIFDGPSNASPSIGKFCGRALPSGFKSHSNNLYIVFKTDHSNQDITETFWGFQPDLPVLHTSVAIGKNAVQTDGSSASLAVDGWTDTCTATASVAAQWTLDLTDYYLIQEVSIHSAYEAKSYTIEMGLALGKYEADNILDPTTSSPATWRPASNGPYKHVRIKANPQTSPLKLCEVQIMGSPQPRTPPFRVFTGIAMSNPPVRTVSSVKSQIECLSICMRTTKPECVTAQFDETRKICAMFDRFENTDDPSNENTTLVFAFAAHCFTN